MNKRKDNFTGHFYEILSIIYLSLKGYRLLKRNFKMNVLGTGAGEIDLIFKRFGVIVFVEVKLRKTLEEALYSISENQKRRIRKSAEVFLKYNSKYSDLDIRFDAILFKHFRKPLHIKNAF